MPASWLAPAATMPAPRNGDERPQPLPVLTFVAPYDRAVASVRLRRLNCQKLCTTSPSITNNSPSEPTAPSASGGMRTLTTPPGYPQPGGYWTDTTGSEPDAA